MQRREEIERELTDEEITGDRAAQFLEDIDEYVGRGVFWVPPRPAGTRSPRARRAGSDGRTVGELIDGAMDEIERVNPEL